MHGVRKAESIRARGPAPAQRPRRPAAGVCGYHVRIAPQTPDSATLTPATARTVVDASPARWIALALQLVLPALAVVRLLYHTAYLRDDPFALVPTGDGRAYETAARDLARHFPLGSEPLQLDGLYAYVLALPLSVLPWLAFALLLQLLLAAFALFLFHRSARRAFGALPAAFGSALLLAYPMLAFFENKWSDGALRAALSIAALWAFGRALERATAPRAALFGATAGLACAAHPWALFAVPGSALAVCAAARADGRSRARALWAFGVGCALSFAPLALRNASVLQSPELLPRHALSIPLFIGNNPRADGLFNDGGVLDRARPGGRAAFVKGLSLPAGASTQADEAVDRALYAHAAAFAREDPGRWLALTARKAWHALGNDERPSHYDLAGERELLGADYQRGLPFGVIAALGMLGLVGLLRRGAAAPEQRARGRAWAFALGAQLCAPAALLLLGYASAENRLPAVVPLCFAAGPAVAALARTTQTYALRLRRPELWLAGALCAQAFVPRGANDAPSAWHYFYLADVKLRLGDMPAAVANYGRAIERDPTQPRFLLSQARLLRLLTEAERAQRVLARLERLPRLSPELQVQVRNERKLLGGLKRYRACLALPRDAQAAAGCGP